MAFIKLFCLLIWQKHFTCLNLNSLVTLISFSVYDLCTWLAFFPWTTTLSSGSMQNYVPLSEPKQMTEVYSRGNIAGAEILLLGGWEGGGGAGRRRRKRRRSRSRRSNHMNVYQCVWFVEDNHLCIYRQQQKWFISRPEKTLEESEYSATTTQHQ